MLIFIYVPSGSHTSPHRSRSTVPTRPSVSFAPSCVVCPPCTCPPSLLALELALSVCTHVLLPSRLSPTRGVCWLNLHSSMPTLNLACFVRGPDSNWVWFALEPSLEDRSGRLLSSRTFWTRRTRQGLLYIC